jgi:hypothetical protein
VGTEVAPRLSLPSAEFLNPWGSDPQVSKETPVGAVGRWFKSGARNHLQADRPLEFSFEIAT